MADRWSAVITEHLLDFLDFDCHWSAAAIGNLLNFRYQWLNHYIKTIINNHW